MDHSHINKSLTDGCPDMDKGSASLIKDLKHRDLHATMLNRMGIDHTQLTYRYAGRDFRLTDFFGEVVHDIPV